MWAEFQLPKLLAVISLGFIFGCPKDVEHANVAFDISSDGKKIVFSSANGEIFLLTMETEQVSRVTNSSVKETQPQFSPDDETVVYSGDVEGSKGRSIFGHSVRGQQVKRLTKDRDVHDCKPCYSPDGSQIAFARAHLYRPYSTGGYTWDDWDVYVMDSGGKHVRRLTQKKHYGITRVVFSEDGKSIFYSADPARYPSKLGDTIFEVPTDGSTPARVVTTQPNSTQTINAWASEPDLSADGKQFVFISDREDSFSYDITVMNRESGNCRSLGVTKISHYNKNPVLTPDGKRVLFLAGSEWNASSRPIFTLWSVDLDGNNQKRVITSEVLTDPLKR
jgi:Tol biopolymer transport system component